MSERHQSGRPASTVRRSSTAFGDTLPERGVDPGRRQRPPCSRRRDEEHAHCRPRLLQGRGPTEPWTGTARALPPARTPTPLLPFVEQRYTRPCKPRCPPLPARGPGHSYAPKALSQSEAHPVSKGHHPSPQILESSTVPVQVGCADQRTGSPVGCAGAAGGSTKRRRGRQIDEAAPGAARHRYRWRSFAVLDPSYSRQAGQGARGGDPTRLVVACVPRAQLGPGRPDLRDRPQPAQRLGVLPFTGDGKVLFVIRKQAQRRPTVRTGLVTSA